MNQFLPPHPKDLRSQGCESMISAGRFFQQRGWLLGTCGNLSVKYQEDPVRILVTKSGRDKSRLRPSDFLAVDENSQAVEHPDKASEELAVHQVIYRRTTAQAVYHIHSKDNNLASRLWAAQGYVEFSGMEMIKGLSGKILGDTVRLPIVANSHDMKALAQSVDQGLDPTVPAVLVYQHGLYAWGDHFETTRRHVEIFEFLLEYVVELAKLGLVTTAPAQLPQAIYQEADLLV